MIDFDEVYRVAQERMFHPEKSDIQFPKLSDGMEDDVQHDTLAIKFFWDMLKEYHRQLSEELSRQGISI